MNIVEIARQYFQLESKGNGIYQIINPSGEFDSVVLWEETNTYRRFSISKSGGIREFLKYIVGLPDNEIEADYGNVEQDNLVKALRRYSKTKQDTDYSLQDIIYEPGYNSYIESRMISEKTAAYYNLEINGKDVSIPLYNRTKNRVGSLYRNANPDLKGDRYRTQLAGNNEKPCVWPFPELYKMKGNTKVVLVEGAWSVMRVHQVIKPLYPNILPLATLGTNLTSELKEYLQDFPVIAILDDDIGGNGVSNTLRKWRNSKMKIEMYLPTWSALSNVQSSYVDDLSDRALIKLFAHIAQVGSIL